MEEIYKERRKKKDETKKPFKDRRKKNKISFTHTKKLKNDLKEEKFFKVLEFKNDGRSKKLH